MLQTQIKIGQQVSRKYGKWDGILHKPTVETELKKTGEKITSYVLSIVFDLDANCIGVSPAELGEYDAERSPEQHFNVKIQGGNNKAFYICAEPEKLEQLRKSFFGVIGKKTQSVSIRGQFAETIDKDFPALKKTHLYQTLTAIFNLRHDFENRIPTTTRKTIRTISV